MFNLVKFFQEWRRESQADTARILTNQQLLLRQGVAAEGRLRDLQQAVSSIRDGLVIGVLQSIAFRVSLDGGATFQLITEGEIMQAKVTDRIRVHVEGRDAFGNPAPFDPSTPLQWTSTGDVVVTVDPTDTSKAALESGEHKVSSGNLAQVTADADAGPEVNPINGSLPIDWLPGDAVTVELKVDAVEPAA
jgi:hypothetical protein